MMFLSLDIAGVKYSNSNLKGISILELEYIKHPRAMPMPILEDFLFSPVFRLWLYETIKEIRNLFSLKPKPMQGDI
jgi:hypothetical protein